jgi:hypothetical protein
MTRKALVLLVIEERRVTPGMKALTSACTPSAPALTLALPAFPSSHSSDRDIRSHRPLVSHSRKHGNSQGYHRRPRNSLDRLRDGPTCRGEPEVGSGVDVQDMRESTGAPKQSLCLNLEKLTAWTTLATEHEGEPRGLSATWRSSRGPPHGCPERPRASRGRQRA